MSSQVDQDRKMLESMPRHELLDLFFLHIRNLWRVDGLYFLGIEEKFGTDAATEIDMNCWRLMGRLEARELRKLLNIKDNDLVSFMHVLRHTGWALDQRDKETEVSESKAVFRVIKCRTQETRIQKGLGEFPCKPVRFGYLKAFAEEFNPNIEASCKICPPGKHPSEVWCEWEFKLRKRVQ